MQTEPTRVTGPIETVVGAFTQNWWLFLVRGIAAIAFGVISIVWPDISLTAIAILFGIYALIDGAGAIWAAFQKGLDTQHRWFFGLEGVAAIIVGVISLVIPEITALSLVILIGIWGIATGVAEIGAAIRLRKMIQDEWVLGLLGVLSILTGVVILVWPDAGAVAIAWVIGVYAIVFGIGLIMLAMRLRKVHTAATK
jgi:uncharacterized membrane protein HdeD (DUF308 family)